MKRILTILLLTSVYFSSFGQADQDRFHKTPLSGANNNKTSIRDANLTAVYNLRMPSWSSFNLFNAKPDSSGYISYQNVIKRAGIYNGNSWDTLAFKYDLGNYMTIPDGLKRLDSIKVSGLTVTAYAPIQWRIGGVNYQKLTNSVFVVPTTTSGYNRIDLLYATTSNTVLRLQGMEAIGIATAPLVPNNSISVALLYINDGVINQPFPDLSDYVTNSYLSNTYFDKTQSDGRYIFANPSTPQNAFISIGDNNNSVRIEKGIYFKGGGEVTNSSIIHAGGMTFNNGLGTYFNFYEDGNNVFHIGSLADDNYNWFLRRTGFKGGLTIETTPTLDNLPTQVLTRDSATGNVKYVPSTSLGGGGTGTVTSVALSAPTGFSVSGSPVTTAGALALGFSSGYSLPSDALQATWTAKQNAISLTTTGTSGAATLIGSTLNIPQYAGATYSAGNGLSLTSNTFSADTSILATKANTLTLAQTFTRFGSGNFYPQPAIFTGGGTSTSDYFNIIGATGVSGTGSVLMGTSPTMVTPTLGVATATSINKVTITAPTTNATLTLVQGSSLITAGAFSNTITTTANTTVTFPTTGTLYGTATGSVTSAQLLASLSNETGTGVAVFGTSPTITTPNLTYAIANKTATYTVTLTDYALTGDATTASFTMTLPTAASSTGKMYSFKKIDATANTVTVKGNGAELIDGTNTKVISTQYSGFTLISNGTVWYVLL